MQRTGQSRPWYARRTISSLRRPKCVLEGYLRKILITRHSRLLNPLQILPLNQTLNLLLNHIDIRLELRAQLTNRLSEELSVRE